MGQAEAGREKSRPGAMYELQPQQLLFLRVKLFLRNNAAVQQFLEFFQFISGGNSGCLTTFLFFAFFNFNAYIIGDFFIYF